MGFSRRSEHVTSVLRVRFAPPVVRVSTGRPPAPEAFYPCPSAVSANRC